MNKQIFTVVYADDEPDVRNVVAQLLRSYGFLVHPCAGGEEAIAACSTLRPDAVLLDINMPVVDGFEAAERIGEMNCTGRMVAITGCATPEAREQARRSGFDMLLAKPVSGSALANALTHAPSRSR
jgi:CheY-like chemotaxis protein